MIKKSTSSNIIIYYEKNGPLSYYHLDRKEFQKCGNVNHQIIGAVAFNSNDSVLYFNEAGEIYSQNVTVHTTPENANPEIQNGLRCLSSKPSPLITSVNDQDLFVITNDKKLRIYFNAANQPLINCTMKEIDCNPERVISISSELFITQSEDNKFIIWKINKINNGEIEITPGEEIEFKFKIGEKGGKKETISDIFYDTKSERMIFSTFDDSGEEKKLMFLYSVGIEINDDAFVLDEFKKDILSLKHGRNRIQKIFMIGDIGVCFPEKEFDKLFYFKIENGNFSLLGEDKLIVNKEDGFESVKDKSFSNFMIGSGNGAIYSILNEGRDSIIFAVGKRDLKLGYSNY